MTDKEKMWSSVGIFLIAIGVFIAGVLLGVDMMKDLALERGCMVWQCADGDCKAVWKDEAQ